MLALGAYCLLVWNILTKSDMVPFMGTLSKIVSSPRARLEWKSGLHPSDHSTAKVNIARKVLSTPAKLEQADARCEAEPAVEHLN